MEMIVYIDVKLASSIRVIAIVKNPITEQDAYTIEFECIADESENLMKELTKTPLGERAIELINQANFMPEQSVDTAEEIKIKAEEEEKRIKEHEDKIKKQAEEKGVDKRDTDWRVLLRDKLGDEKADELIAAMESKTKEEKKEESDREIVPFSGDL